MAAVSDSSPLILYAAIGRLDIVEALFAPVYVPQAVYAEVVTAGASRPGADEVRSAPWIVSRSATRQDLLQTLAGEVDVGEAEAIVLAIELGRIPVLLDDRAARRLARASGLPLFGSAGVLLLAKRQGLLPLARPTLDQLRSVGLYLSDTVYQGLLARAGE